MVFYLSLLFSERTARREPAQWIDAVGRYHRALETLSFSPSSRSPRAAAYTKLANALASSSKFHILYESPTSVCAMTLRVRNVALVRLTP